MVFTKILMISVAAALAAAVALPVAAQINPDVAEFTTEIEASRSLVQTERKILILQQMTLSPEEATEF
jgi:hypothetical protein